MKTIFISYRRNNTAHVVAALADRLSAAFGPGTVFTDVDAIPVGIDFRNALEFAVSQSEIMLVVIGHNWLGSRGDLGIRRIDNPNASCG